MVGSFVLAQICRLGISLVLIMVLTGKFGSIFNELSFFLAK